MNIPQTNYNYFFDIAALCNYLAVLSFSVRPSRKNMPLQGTIFHLLALDGIVSSIFDILTAFTNTPGILPVSVGYAANFLYLSIHNLQTVLFLLYTLCLTGRLTHRNVRKKVPISLGTYAITFVLLVTNFFTKGVFYYDVDGVYRHGPLIYVIYAVAVGYVLAVFASLIAHQKRMVFRDTVSVAFLVFGAALSIGLQLAFPTVWVELFVQSLLFFALLIALEAKNILLNPETGSYNLQGFTEYVQKLLKSNVKSTIVMVHITGLSYYSTFISIEKRKAVESEIVGFLKAALDTETVYNCEGSTFAVVKSSLTIEEARKTFSEAKTFYDSWPESRHVTFQTAKFDIPDNVDTIEDVLLFIHTNYISKDSTYLIPDNEIRNIHRKNEVKRAVQRGLAEKNFYVHVQPIVDKNTGMLHSAEILCRLTDSVMGNLPPFEFITAAEDCGLIWEIGLFTLEEACRILHNPVVTASGLSFLEVNLSAVQFMHGGCRDAFMEILNRYHVKPSQINLEITESAFVNDPVRFLKEKDDLQAAGFAFSIDDYGSGFSNYKYIKSTHPAIIKLDRDSLLDAEKDREGLIFYQNLISSIHELGYEIVTEGVETEAQLAIVRNTAADYVQGYYFSKPLSVDDFFAYCRRETGLG